VEKLTDARSVHKEPYLWLRLYAPEEAFWSKTFKIPDLELVNQ